MHGAILSPTGKRLVTSDVLLSRYLIERAADIVLNSHSIWASGGWGDTSGGVRCTVRCHLSCLSVRKSLQDLTDHHNIWRPIFLFNKFRSGEDADT
jgi:hypothetical protein